MGAALCELELFPCILNLAKDNLTTEGVNKLLLVTDNEGMTVFHVTATLCELEIFKGILNLVKENLTTEEVNKLSVTTGNEGRKVWQVVAWRGKINSLEKICT